MIELIVNGIQCATIFLAGIWAGLAYLKTRKQLYFLLLGFYVCMFLGVSENLCMHRACADVKNIAVKLFDV